MLIVNYSVIVNAKPQQQMHTSLIILYSKEETLIGHISPMVILCYTYNDVLRNSKTKTDTCFLEANVLLYYIMF